MIDRELRAVLFDYGHTLIHFDDAPHDQLLTSYQRINDLLRAELKCEVPEARALIDNVSRKVDEQIQRDYEAGREEEVEIARLYDEALRRIGLELTPQLIEQVMEIEQNGWLRSVHVGSDVKPTLGWIRDAGLRLGLVSNAAYLPSLMEGQMEALGLRPFFDSVTFSSGVGWRKPHRAIYEDALGQLRVPPPSALFVGDRVREDVRGPKAMGMRAVLVREWRQEADLDGEADYVIDHLGDLREVLVQLLRNRIPRPDDKAG